MLYVTIDIETTGIDPEKDQILEFGAILENTSLKLPYDQLPKFQKFIKHDRYTGNIKALAMNADILQILADNPEELKNDICTPDQLLPAFQEWLISQRFKAHVDENSTCDQLKTYVKVNAAGKNFGAFDLQFLKKLPNASLIRFLHRHLDPAILYLNWQDDNELPNLLTCKQRAGIEGTVKHRTLEDDWDVIQLLRKFY